MVSTKKWTKTLILVTKWGALTHPNAPWHLRGKYNFAESAQSTPQNVESLTKTRPSWAAPYRPPTLTCDSSRVTQTLCPESLLRWSCRRNYTIEVFMMPASPLGALLPAMPMWFMWQSPATLLSPSIVALWAYFPLRVKDGRPHPSTVLSCLSKSAPFAEGLQSYFEESFL